MLLIEGSVKNLGHYRRKLECLVAEASPLLCGQASARPISPPRASRLPQVFDTPDDGRVEMDSNVVERAIRPNVLTRKNALFAGSDSGARSWAVAMTLIQTAKLNGVEPMAWLTDVLECVVSGRTKAHKLHTLLPWNWHANSNADRPTTA